MKTIRFLFFFFLLGITHFSLEARHLSGGNMTYECLGNGDYQIDMVVFRDATCDNCADLDNFAPIAIYKCSLEDNCSILDQSSPIFTMDVPLGGVESLVSASDYTCGGMDCSVGDMVQVEQGVYSFKLSEFDISLENSNESYFIVYQRCCLGILFSNLDNPGEEGFTVSTEITPRSQSECNSMPVSENYAGTYVTCAKELTTLKFVAKDADGDVLKYYLCPAITGGGRSNGGGNQGACDSPEPNPPCPPPFNQIQIRLPDYSWTEPIDTEAGVSLDEDTGTLEFTPSSIGIYLVSLCIYEYRDSVFLSSQIITFQVNVVGDCQTISVIDKNLSAKINVHPNPARHVIQVELPEIFQPDFYTIKNIAGKEFTGRMTKFKKTIDVSFLPKGLYFLELEGNEMTAVKKFIVD